MTAQEDSDCPCEPSIDDLMRRVKRRDLLAFERLYCLMRPVIMWQAIAGGWQKAAADDIVQEVFLRVWENPDRFDSQRSAIAYLFGISRNVMRQHYKAAGKTVWLADQSLPEPAIAQDPAAQMERNELAHTLVAARSGLSENQTVALRLVYEEGMPPRHAASHLGCSEHAIRWRLRAARCKLRRLLRRQMPLAILPGGLFGNFCKHLPDMNRPYAKPGEIRWGAVWLLGVALLVSDRPLEHHGTEAGGSPPRMRSSLHGEGAPDPPAQVELVREVTIENNQDYNGWKNKSTK